MSGGRPGGERFVVVGGGIVGLAVAHRILLDRPGSTVTVLEKEHRVAAHQTGRNSGVIHAGVYYRPGSLKATLCKAGAASMVAFCRAYDVPVDVCGKLIVAVDDTELPRLHALHERSVANGLDVRLVTPAEARELEPAVACVAAMHVATTGITSYARVCQVLARLVGEAGGSVVLGAKVTAITAGAVVSTAGDHPFDVLVNCAGLHADRIAAMAGVRPGARIVPFRGEYFTLRDPSLVNGLIYPVPDPRFPFLGVHLTRMVDGSVHAGPNAVLALAREGYTWGTWRPRDMLSAATHPGLWRLARTNLRYGLGEVARSLSKRRFAASVARLVPSVAAADLVPAEAGVRAQAIDRSGALVDDFLIQTVPGQVHVLNAPSPAATSALEIARHIVDRLPVVPFDQ